MLGFVLLRKPRPRPERLSRPCESSTGIVVAAGPSGETTRSVLAGAPSVIAVSAISSSLTRRSGVDVAGRVVHHELGINSAVLQHLRNHRLHDRARHEALAARVVLSDEEAQVDPLIGEGDVP